MAESRRYPFESSRRQIESMCHKAVWNGGSNAVLLFRCGPHGTATWIESGQPRRWEILPGVWLCNMIGHWGPHTNEAVGDLYAGQALYAIQNRRR